MANKFKAYATHPNGDVELKRGDKVATKGGSLLTFAYVTDDGKIATQGLGCGVVVLGADNYPGVVVRGERKTIDLTPTWVAVLPMLLAALEDGSDKGKAIAREELHRMAQAADAYNAKR